MSKNIEELRESGIACRGTITHVEWVRKSFSIQKSDRARYRVRVEAPGREPFEIDVLYRHPAWSEGLKVDTTVPAFAHPTLDEAYLDFEAVDTISAVDRALPKEEGSAEPEAVAEAPVEAPQQPAYENRLIGLPESDAAFNGIPMTPAELDEPVPVSIAPSAATPVALLPESAFEHVDGARPEPVAAAPVFAAPEEAPVVLPVSEAALAFAVPAPQPDEDHQPAADPYAPVQPISQAGFAPAPQPQAAPVAAIQPFAMPFSEPVVAPTPFGSVFGEATPAVQTPVHEPVLEQVLPASPQPFVEVPPEPVAEVSAPFNQQPFVLSQAIRGESVPAELEPVAPVAEEPVVAPLEPVAEQAPAPLAEQPAQPVFSAAPAPLAPPAPPTAVVYPAPPAPPVWHRDPSGRHELRYWDGVRWTEHVSSAGAQSVDPI